MTRAEAYKHIAEVMGEWWPQLEYTPEQVAQQFVKREMNPKFVDGTEMWYPFFAMDVLVQAGLIEDVVLPVVSPDAASSG